MLFHHMSHIQNGIYVVNACHFLCNHFATLIFTDSLFFTFVVQFGICSLFSVFCSFFFVFCPFFEAIKAKRTNLFFDIKPKIRAFTKQNFIISFFFVSNNINADLHWNQFQTQIMRKLKTKQNEKKNYNNKQMK